MKALSLVLVVFVSAFLLIGCSDTRQDIISANNTDKIPVPFKGDWEGLTYMTSETGRLVTCNGNCTHIGLYDAVVTYDVTYNAPPPYTTGGAIENGAATMTAANGDKLYLGNLTGSWWFANNPPTLVGFTCNGDIVGGTGRFSSATGTLQGTGTQNFYMTEPTRPQEVWYNWTGSISY